MSRYIRSKIKGGVYFFTATTLNRQPILTKPPFIHALKSAIQTTQQIYPFHIDAWVVLPDHMHCIWTLPDTDDDYSKRWSIIKRKVSSTCMNHFQATLKSRSHSIRRESGLWQRRFWEHQIRNERDYQTHMDYIHWNPVKHGLVQSVRDWPYSTFHKLVKRDVYPVNWGTNTSVFESKSFGE